MSDTEKMAAFIDESKFTAEQLEELRKGQELSLPVHLYANPMFTPAEMAIYRTFLDTATTFTADNEAGRYVVTEYGPEEASYGFKSRSNYEKHPERVCYIPENWDFEEGPGYNAFDFLELCGGDRIKAGIVFDLCEWEHPETVLDQWDHDDDLALAEIKEKKIRQLEDEIFTLRQNPDTELCFTPEDTLTPAAFRAFLRTLQENPYNWPNRYFAWEKPDGTQLMIGVASTQMYHMIKREFCQSETQVKLGLPGEYVSYLYGISPNVTYMQNNIKYDPIEKLVDEIRGYRYLGAWDDPDLLMDSPRGFNRVLACGRWNLAKEHILGNREEEKPPLDTRISEASERAGNQTPANTTAHNIVR